MSHTKMPLARAIQHWAADARTRIALHPSPDDLLRYHAAEMSTWQEATLQEHLAVCPDCARTVVDLDSFPQLEPGDESAPQEVAADWQEIRALLAEDAGSVEDTDAGEKGRLAEVKAFPMPGTTVPATDDVVAVARGGSRRPRRMLAWAAALVPAILGWGLWIAAQQSLSRPRANVEIIDLVPVEEALVRDEAGGEIVLSAEAGAVVLVLNLTDLRAFDTYRVDVSDASGRQVGRYGGLKRGREGNFTLSFPRRALPPETLRFDLYGVGTTDKLLATYRMRLSGAPD